MDKKEKRYNKYENIKGKVKKGVKNE